jgi:hypothetical protein
MARLYILTYNGKTNSVLLHIFVLCVDHIPKYISIKKSLRTKHLYAFVFFSDFFVFNCN